MIVRKSVAARSLSRPCPRAASGGAFRAEDATLRSWHLAVREKGASKRKEILRDHVAEYAVFRPPTYFKPWTGREELLVLLECASEVFGESFAYRREWISEDGRDWCLEFEAEIDGKTLQGVDLVKLDPDGKIVELSVLARPPNAVEALKSAMLAKVPLRMAALKAKQALFGSSP